MLFDLGKTPSRVTRTVFPTRISLDTLVNSIRTHPWHLPAFKCHEWVFEWRFRQIRIQGSSFSNGVNNSAEAAGLGNFAPQSP